MAKLEVSIEHTFVVAANRATTWEFLIDTPMTVGHYPKLDRLVDLGDGRWRWELKELGGKGFTHQIVYAVQYHFDASAGSIIWEPIPDEGNSIIRGSFQIDDHADGTQVILATDGSLDVPVPRLLKSFAKPYVTSEFSEQIHTFANNLQKAIK